MALIPGILFLPTIEIVIYIKLIILGYAHVACNSYKMCCQEGEICFLTQTHAVCNGFLHKTDLRTTLSVHYVYVYVDGDSHLSS